MSNLQPQTHPLTQDINMYLQRLRHAVWSGTTYPHLSNDLRSFLGCSYLVRSGDATTPALGCDSVHEADRLAANAGLRDLLRATISAGPQRAGDIASLLTGLCLSCEWMLCLNDQETAYALACAVIDFSDHYNADCALDVFALTHVTTMLNEWLTPSVLWANLPDVSEIASGLFGRAWYTLVLVAADQDSAYLTVLKDRPTFMPGLCPALCNDTDLNQPLPELDLTLK